MSVSTRRFSAPAPFAPSRRPVRAVTGVVAAGVLVLALMVVVAAMVASPRAATGPGVGSIVAHTVAAAVVVAAQLAADRSHRGPAVIVGPVIVLGVAATLLWTQWLG